MNLSSARGNPCKTASSETLIKFPSKHPCEVQKKADYRIVAGKKDASVV
jgi:hypothetical protein